jgi:WD40 repeat protein
MPKAIVVISDMEIDRCGNKDWSFYDKMAAKFAKHGYVIPNIIFWNVNSRHDVFHADSSRKGVQLASGQSVTVFKQILQNLGYNPVEAMENTINSDRYSCITVEKAV